MVCWLAAALLVRAEFFWLGAAVMALAIPVYLLGARFLRVKRLEGERVWIAGASINFLARLPGVAPTEPAGSDPSSSSRCQQGLRTRGYDAPHRVVAGTAERLWIAPRGHRGAHVARGVRAASGKGERRMDLTRRDGRLLLLGITLIACLALLALGVAAPQAKAADVGYNYYITGDPSDAVTTTQPGLLLAGGATDQDAAVQWWLGRAGDGDVVVIAASGDDDYSPYFYDTLGGVDSVEMFVLGTRKASFDPFLLEKLNEADAIYVDGGNQWLYYSYLVGTPAEAIINAAARVKPEGGISAGLAVQGQFAYVGAEGHDHLGPGAGEPVPLARHAGERLPARAAT